MCTKSIFSPHTHASHFESNRLAQRQGLLPHSQELHFVLLAQRQGLVLYSQ